MKETLRGFRVAGPRLAVRHGIVMPGSSVREGLARRVAAASVLALLAMLIAPLAAARAAGPPPPLRVDSLTTEHLVNPLGIDASHPRLGWVARSSGRGVSQVAYRILVASSPANLAAGDADVWDSGRVSTPQSFDIPYAGPALQPRTRFFWEVKIWDNHGNVSDWSQPAWFETAFLDPSTFQGSWIGRYSDNNPLGLYGPEVLVRKQFALHGGIESARLYTSALGYGYTYINGRRVSDHLLDTAFTAYTKTVDYTTYDVTGLLGSGANVIGVSLGNGMYAEPARDYGVYQPWQPSVPKLKLELDIRYSDGSSAQVLSDTSWVTSPGAATFNSPQAENHDARLEPPGWSSVGFNAAAWTPVVEAGTPTGVLRAQMIPPIKQAGTLSPVKVTKPLENVKVYDFGITTAGWSRIRLQGTAGTTIVVNYSEKLNPNGDGTVEDESQGDQYTLKGGGPETYDPEYSWKGYRYIQVSTTPSTDSSSTTPLPEILSVKGAVVHTALPTTGDFHSTSELFNRMHVAMRNTILNNQYSYGSDTPIYEKGAWTGDYGMYSNSEMFNFDTEAYWEHTLQTFDDSQLPTGNIGLLAPTPPADNVEDPLWGGEFVLIEYNAFMQYDDLALLRRDYAAMAAYVDEQESVIQPTGYIYNGNSVGDWVVPTNANAPSNSLLGSMFIYREAKVLAIMAAAIGNTADATKYDQLADKVADAVNNKFYDATNHAYHDPAPSNSAYQQTANVIALAFGLPPAGDRQAVADGLAADVVAKGNHLATGANGSKYILPVLTENGQSDLAYKVATNPTYPGWGNWFQQCGASTMWEAWECDTARSHDHAFMGTVDDWFFNDVAGIRPASPGFRTTQIKPYAVNELSSASAHEATPFGQVSSSWERSGTQFNLTVKIPVGATARVFVPAADSGSVTERGQPITTTPGVTVVGMDGAYLQLEAGSGTYKFQSTMM
jgi:alpha-L-rhamnosidase